MRAELLCQLKRQEVLAERDIVSQLQEHLAETQAQVDDWSFWYDQEYGSEYEMVQEEQEDDGEAAEVNQVQPVMSAPQQPQSTPLTPPDLQGHVPVEHLPPAQIPSFALTPLPPIQPSTRLPPPPPPGPPPSEEPPPQISQPVTQQQAQPESSVPSQQSLPSTHRCPDVLGPAAPMTQEYVPHGGVLPPMTPNACLQEGMTRVPIAPTSPPGPKASPLPRPSISPLCFEQWQQRCLTWPAHSTRWKCRRKMLLHLRSNRRRRKRRQLRRSQVSLYLLLHPQIRQ